MKYLSYLIIIAVISLIGWTTDNSLQSIFVVPQEVQVVKAPPAPEVQQKEDITAVLNTLLGE